MLYLKLPQFSRIPKVCGELMDSLRIRQMLERLRLVLRQRVVLHDLAQWMLACDTGGMDASRPQYCICHHHALNSTLQRASLPSYELNPDRRSRVILGHSGSGMGSIFDVRNISGSGESLLIGTDRLLDMRKDWRHTMSNPIASI